MLRITLLAALVILLWNVPEARQYTARSLRAVAEVIEPTDTTKSFKDWFNRLLD